MIELTLWQEAHYQPKLIGIAVITIDLILVSPGSNMDTNAGRHTTGFKKFLFTKIMPALGPSMGMSQPVPLGAKRYVDVLDGNGEFVNGSSYMSKPKKLVGTLVETKNAHFLDTERQEVAWEVLGELIGVTVETAVS